MLAKERLENRQFVENQKKTIERLEERLGKLEVDKKEIRDKYQNQANIIKENSKEIEMLKNENANLNQMLQIQNDDILNIHQKLQTFEKKNPKDFKKTLDDQRKDVENLKTFAKSVLKMHETLSDVNVRDKCETYHYLYNKDYSTDQDARQWNDFVQQAIANKDFDGDCDYLQQMKNVLVRYQKTVYTKSWFTRLFQFAYAIDHGMIIRDHIKLCSTYVVKYISVKDHNTRYEFDTTTQDMKWTKHSHLVASYLSRHQGSLCLDVAIILPSCYKNIYILHWKEEEKKLRIPLDGRVVFLNEGSFYTPFIMLQLER